MRKLASLVLFCALAFYGSVSAADTKKVDDEGFIRNWLVLGPIDLGADVGDHAEETQKPILDKEYFAGQLKATPSDGEKVKIGNSEVAWKAFQADDSIFTFTEQDNSLNLVVAYIICEADIADVNLKIGSDDSSLWRLNNEEIIRVYSGRGTEQDQDTSKKVTLKKGCNVLYGAVINGGGPTGACARFTKDDNPVKNIAISLAPVK
jgi:hypothetical protein